MKLMGRVGLVLSALVVVNILTLHWAPLYADLIHSAQDAAPAAPAGDRAAVAHQLAGIGLGSQDISSRMSELQPADLAVLSQNPEQMQCAGTAPIVAFVLIGLAVVILLVLFDSFSMTEDPEPIAEPK